MTKERSKRHHYIPQFLIKNWADELGRVWVYNQKEQRIYRTSTANVFVARDLYTYQEGLDGPKSDEIEKQFAREEGKVSAVIEKIIKGARDKHSPRLNSDEVYSCQKFLLSFVRRTPESQARVSNYDGDVFFEAVKQTPGSSDHGLDDPAVLYSVPRVEELKQMVESNSAARFAAGDIADHQAQAEAYASMTGLESRVILNSRRSFALGSLGYCYVDKLLKKGKFHTVAWFPIAPDVVLALTDAPGRMRASCIMRDGEEDRFVRQVNKSIETLSGYIIGRDKQLLEAYRRRFLRRTRTILRKHNTYS